MIFTPTRVDVLFTDKSIRQWPIYVIPESLAFLSSQPEQFAQRPGPSFRRLARSGARIAAFLGVAGPQVGARRHRAAAGQRVLGVADAAFGVQPEVFVEGIAAGARKPLAGGEIDRHGLDVAGDLRRGRRQRSFWG